MCEIISAWAEMCELTENAQVSRDLFCGWIQGPSNTKYPFSVLTITPKNQFDLLAV